MEDKIKTMVENGMAISRIAKILNICLDDIKNIIKNNSLSLKKEIFTEDKIPHIFQLYKDGVSAKKLALKFSIDKRRVQKWANEGNILRNVSDAIRVTHWNQKRFDTVTTAEQAYWLGFFYADAYNNVENNTFSIALKAEDKPHLIKLAKFLEYPQDQIVDGVAELNGNFYPTTTLRLCSKYFCEKLASLGCPQAKSFIIKYPAWLDSSLNVHFIRGMFDGDGCLTFRKKQKEWKWSLTSTLEGCISIQKIINDNIDIFVNYEYISETENNTYNLYLGGNQQINKILDWFYLNSNEEIRLNRKYELYLRLIDQQESRKINRKEYFLSDELKNNILKDFSNGMSYKNIILKYDTNRTTINRIKRNYDKSRINS